MNLLVLMMAPKRKHKIDCSCLKFWNRTKLLVGAFKIKICWNFIDHNWKKGRKILGSTVEILYDFYMDSFVSSRLIAYYIIPYNLYVIYLSRIYSVLYCTVCPYFQKQRNNFIQLLIHFSIIFSSKRSEKVFKLRFLILWRT